MFDTPKYIHSGKIKAQAPTRNIGLTVIGATKKTINSEKANPNNQSIIRKIKPEKIALPAASIALFLRASAIAVKKQAQTMLPPKNKRTNNRCVSNSRAALIFSMVLAKVFLRTGF